MNALLAKFIAQEQLAAEQGRQDGDALHLPHGHGVPHAYRGHRAELLQNEGRHRRRTPRLRTHLERTREESRSGDAEYRADVRVHQGHCGERDRAGVEF